MLFKMLSIVSAVCNDICLAVAVLCKGKREIHARQRTERKREKMGKSESLRNRKKRVVIHEM